MACDYLAREPLASAWAWLRRTQHGHCDMTTPIWRFAETESYALPAGYEALVVTTADGRKLRAVRWPARLDPKRMIAPQGTVCLMQGRAEFIEKYAETIEDLLQRGFAVVTFDWRGQGLSDRELPNAFKGHVADFRQYRLDLDAVIAQAVPDYWPRPLFGLAHSMGGAILLQALANGFDHFARVVLSAPMIDIKLPMSPRAARYLARSLAAAGLSRAWIPGGGRQSVALKPFAGNALTSDARRYARNAALIVAGQQAGIDIGIGDPSVGWLNAAFRCMDSTLAPAFTRAIATPVLIIAAGSDRVVSTPAIERLAMRLKTGRAIVLPGAQHELLMEQDEIRDSFFAAFDAFIPGSAAEFAPQPLSV